MTGKWQREFCGRSVSGWEATEAKNGSDVICLDVDGVLVTWMLDFPLLIILFVCGLRSYFSVLISRMSACVDCLCVCLLQVGGIKEKVLAAHRAGLTRVILPARNEKDLHEIPANIKVGPLLVMHLL